MGYLRQVLAIVEKDIRQEFRTKEMISTMVIFALLVVVIFGFAFTAGTTSETLNQVFPGILWVAFFFAGVLGLNRSFSGERRNDAIHGLMLCPMDRSAIYFGKVLGNLLFMLTMEIVSLPIFIALMDYRWSGKVGLLALTIFLATLGFILAGTLLAALASNTRSSEILLPIILFPIIAPVVIAAVKVTTAVMALGFSDDIGSGLRLLLIYDLVFLVAPFILFEYLLEV